MCCWDHFPMSFFCPNFCCLCIVWFFSMNVYRFTKKKKRWTTLVNPMEKEKDNETSQKYIITVLICSCYVHPLLPNLYTISLVTIFFTTLFIIVNMVCCDLWLVHNKSSVSGRRRWKWCCSNHKAIVKNIVSLASFICDIFIFYEIPVNIEKLRYFPVAH